MKNDHCSPSGVGGSTSPQYPITKASLVEEIVIHFKITKGVTVAYLVCLGEKGFSSWYKTTRTTSIAEQLYFIRNSSNQKTQV